MKHGSQKSASRGIKVGKVGESTHLLAACKNHLYHFAAQQRNRFKIMAFYISQNRHQLGPFEESQVLEGLREHRFAPDDLAWKDGMPDWQTLRQLFPQTSPPPIPAGAGIPSFTPSAIPPSIGDNAGMRMLLPVGRSGWAIAAGYLGLFCLIVIPAPVALIVSIIAIRDIRKSRKTSYPKHGMGRAIFGLIAGAAGTLLIGAVLISAALE